MTPLHEHHRLTDVCGDCPLPEDVREIKIALRGDYEKAGLITRTVDLEKAVDEIKTGIKKSHDFIRNTMVGLFFVSLGGLGTITWALITHTIDIVSK
jgi:hypothetical protein